MPATTLLALSLGRAEVPAAGTDWETVLAMALRERCAALCWHRSGELIRARAPRGIVDRWRAAALESLEQADTWTRLLAESWRALRAADVDPIVIKGLPLSLRLYGTTAVRPLADLDLFVAAGQRSRARRTLEAAGWTRLGGEAPGEEVYATRAQGRAMRLEVHSSLTDDAILPHLPWPAPDADTISLGGEMMSVQSGPLLAPYLAVHLAKHPMPPLLWFIDFHTLWGAQDETMRAAARQVARTLRAHRYLEWAARRAGELEAAARGDGAAARRLGFQRARRSDVHNALRVATLAASPVDGARVAWAWLVPRELRHSPRLLLGRTVWRLAAPIRRARPTRRYAPTNVLDAASAPRSRARSLPVDAPELFELVRDVTASGNAMWVRACGTSMLPSIASGAQVRLVAPGRVEVGDVVLARLPSGECVLHRVRRLAADAVVLCGDGNVRDDPAIATTSIAAVADRIADERGERPLSPLPGIHSLRRGLRRALLGQPRECAT